jgi:hypothetical protein
VKKSAGAPHGLHTLVSRQKGNDREDYFLLGFGGSNVVFASSVWGVRLTHPFPAVDRWVHVAATRSGDGVARLFVNGEEVARSMSKPLASIRGGRNDLIIGGGVNVPDPGRPTELLEASIDEIAVYDRALAADEIGALAAGTQPAP